MQLGDVDLDSSGYGSLPVDAVSSIEIDGIDTTVTANTLTFAVPAMEVSWGSENATQFDSTKVIATIPMLAAGSTTFGTINVDQANVTALSDYILNTSHKLRFFGRTQVDLSPGQAFPAGSLAFNLSVRLAVIGSTKSL